jgi:zinc transport system permease protein
MNHRKLWIGVLGLLSFASLVVLLGWIAETGGWVDEQVAAFSIWWKATIGEDTVLDHKFMIRGLLGIMLVSLICGVVSSLVVSNRMAFFSDALAHCAFAGVALGLILFGLELLGDDGILATMIAFGALFGVTIAYVRERTPLAYDTVIGVFFAGAMGLGAVLLKGMKGKGSQYNPENFLFGDILLVRGQDLVYLTLLLLGLLGYLWWLYNRSVFISFNPSLARSRNFPVRLGNYLFIVLLALIVNTCLKVAGALLINAFLILPAATAGNLSRNLRQFFWLSIGLSVLAGIAGTVVSDQWTPQLGNETIYLAHGGTIVIIAVLMFFVSMPLSRWIRGLRPTLRTSP